jgi:broad specificity phosphatase PhoE
LPFIHARALIIVRHGDISVEEKARLGNATPLLARGRARAEELVNALKDAGVTRIITSTSRRTQETAAPLAAALGLKTETPVAHGPETRPAGGAGGMRVEESIQREADGFVRTLAEEVRPGETVLVVYHHSIIPSILRALGYEEPAFEDATEFDRVYVVLPEAATGKYRVLRLRYGGRWGNG